MIGGIQKILKSLEGAIIFIPGVVIFFSLFRTIEFRKSQPLKKNYQWVLFVSSIFLVPFLFLPEVDFVNNILLLLLFSLPVSLAIYSLKKKWFLSSISLLLSTGSQYAFTLYTSLHWQFLFDEKGIVKKVWYGKFLSWELIEFMKQVSNYLAVGAILFGIWSLIKADSLITRLLAGATIFYAILSCHNIFIVV
ncbi:MAG: hypothetical protein NC913_07930 [Candidatus Omnitrophica bacterium]|nr:hypothetical protein [Candidatus Omnitrophota bacterium]